MNDETNKTNLKKMQINEKTNVVMNRYFRYVLASFLCFLLFMSTHSMAGNTDAGYRYLRLTALGGVSTYDIYICEIEWMDGSTAYPIVKKTAASSSAVQATVAPDNAWMAYDGIKSLSGVWSPNVTTYPFSITCDLGAGVSIKPSGIKISIEWNARAMSSFTCEGSNDKSTWTNLFTKNGLTENDWVRDATNSFVFPVPDLQAPTIPANLIASNINQSGCTLSWDASTDNIAVASYEVFKDGVSVGTTTSTSLNITGLTSTSTYALTVKAKDTSGNVSEASIPKNVTTTAPDLTAPTKPGGLISSNITFSGFTLTWTASSDNVSVALYEIFKGTTSCGTTTSTSLKITGLTGSMDYSMTVIAKDAAGNASPASDPKLVTTSVYVPGKTGFVEDFNDNNLTGWYAGSYGLTEQAQMLKIVPVKNSVWDGFGFSFPEITIKDAPYVSLKVKSNFDFNISMAVGKANGKIDNYPLRIETIGIAGAQEIVAGSEFQEYSFDYTGLPAGMLDSISNLHFVLNPLTRDFGPAASKEIYFDDIKIGDLADHTPAISAVPDQVFTVAAGTGSRTVSFRNITDGSTDKNSITISASSSNPACIPNPVVNYTSPKRAGSLVLNPILGAAGESRISVMVSAPNTSDKVMTFMVKVVPNQPPTMKTVPDRLAKKGESIVIPLDQISDGNQESTQKVTITATSSDASVIPSIMVQHDSTAFTGSLAFRISPSAATGSVAKVSVKLKDDGGIASGGKDESDYSFYITVYDDINHQPSFDSIPPKSVKAIAGANHIDLSGISDGDNNTQTLSFEIVASTDTVVKNLNIGKVGQGNASLNFDLIGKTGATLITIRATDNGGNGGNNGNQSCVKSFLLTAVPVPITGLVADYLPFVSNIAGTGIINNQSGGKVEIMTDGTVHLSGTVMQQSFPSAYFNLTKLTGGKELDISLNKYVSFKFKGASTNKIEAPENKPLDLTKIFFRLVDNISPGAPGSGYNVSFVELNLANDDQWHDVYLDFSGLFLKTKDGNQTDSTRISRLMLDINDLWFQQIKGDYYFKDIKLGDLADRPVVVAHPTLNPIPDQIILKGEKVRPVRLTGITDGLGNPTATLMAVSNKPSLVSGLNIGNIINGTALLNYSVNIAATDTVRISVIAQNSSSAGSVSDTMTFRVYAIDKATMASGGAVTIDFSKTYQTFAGMGTMFNNGSNYDQVQQVKDLNITLMRLTSDGEFEPVNDNSDPNVTDYSNFNRKALPTDVIREINEKTNCHKFFYTPWSPPNWMKMNKGSNPDPATMWAGNNKLKPEMYEEFAEYLVAICKTIQEEAGVELYAISLQNEPTFNEPYGSCQYTGAEFRDMMKIIGPRFNAENIHTRIMMPEDIATMLDWVSGKIDPVNADPEARKYLGIIAVHLYDPDGINVGGGGSSRWKDLLSIKISTLAEGLWMTETSGFGNVWEGYWGKDYLSGNPQFFPGPLDFAGSMYTAFKTGNISAWTDFEGTAFKIKNDLAGSVFKNFSAYLNPGAVMVDATSTNTKVLSLAFKNTDESVTSILLNTSKAPLKIIVKGNNVPQFFRSFTTGDASPFLEGSNVTDGTVVLPSRSITTLYHSLANLPPTVDQTENKYLELAAGPQTVSLTGITFGADTTKQSVILVKALAANAAVVNPQVEYQAGANTASLKLTPLNYGTSLVSVTVRDNGGIAGGGVDSLTMKFYVSVISKLNHLPTIKPLEQITALEDADSVRVELSGISDGDNGTQALNFNISNKNLDLVRPRISYIQGSDKAMIVFKPAANKNGTDIFTVILTDRGGDATNNGDLSVKLEIPVTIIPVNDAPVIKAILTSASVKGGIVKRFPITIDDGDPEVNQTLSYVLRNPNPDIVDASITVGQPNSLTLNVTGKKMGVANLTFVLKDDGGTLNGGVDSAKVDFTVTILTTVGVDEITSSVISLYPNPATDFITLNLGDTNAEALMIKNVNGEIVLQQEIAADENLVRIPIANQPSGVYLLTVYDGTQYRSLKFIHRK